MILNIEDTEKVLIGMRNPHPHKKKKKPEKRKVEALDKKEGT
jgi:hypothetical protein